MNPATEVRPDIERRRLRALVSAGIATAAPLHAEDYQLITPSCATGSASASTTDPA